MNGDKSTWQRMRRAALSLIAVVVLPACDDARYDDMCLGGLALGAEQYQVALRKTDGSVWTWGNGVVRPKLAPAVPPLEGTFLDGTLCFRTVGEISCPFFVDYAPANRDVLDPRARYVSIWMDPGYDPSPPSICVVSQAGDLTCRWDRAATVVAVATRVRKAAIGRDHVCAIDLDDQVICQNGGVETSSTMDWAQPYPEIPRPADIVATDFASCARTHHGQVWCWGKHDRVGGQTDERPVLMPLTGPAVALVAGHTAICALVEGGDVSCWSDGLPERANLPHPATSIANAYSTTCAVLDDTSVWCWGSSRSGERGDGTTNFVAESVPRPVLGCR